MLIMTRIILVVDGLKTGQETKDRFVSCSLEYCLGIFLISELGFALKSHLEIFVQHICTGISAQVFTFKVLELNLTMRLIMAKLWLIILDQRHC